MRQRGLTFITVLVVLGGILAIGWIATYGPAYWDNTDVNKILKAAANMCYREPNDEKVRAFMLIELHRRFDTGERDTNGEPIMAIDFGDDDIRIERQDQPRWVNIWFTYQRTIKIPFVDQERTITFYDHAEQDLAPVKW